MNYSEKITKKKMVRFQTLLTVVFMLTAGAVIAQPSFTGGAAQTLTVCQNTSANSINSLLSISDPVTGSTETWSAFSSPSHGTLVATYTATSTGGIITPTGLSYSPTAGYSGTDAFTVHVTNGTVTATTVISVTVTAAPAAMSTGTLVCTGSTLALTDGTAGGTWSSATTGVATISSGGTVTGISSGTTVISYTKNGCSVTATITDESAPVAISGASTVCTGSAITLTDASAYGTWSSSSAGHASVNATTGAVTGVAQGTATISYANGCGTAATLTVTAVAAPAVITGTSTICNGATTTLYNTSTGGIWSSSNTSIATNSGSIYTGVGSGTVSVSYATGCGSPATYTLTVKGAPAAISGATTVCVGSTVTMTDTSIGGTWSSSSTGRATVVSTSGVVTGVSAGAVNIVYTNSCGTSATYPITVIALPAPITGTTTVCATADVILADATTGGIWSTSNAAIATNSGSDITGVSAGSVTVTYSTGCGTPATTIVTVRSTPSTITGASTLCVGSSITFTDSSAGGTWSSSYTPRASIISATGVATGVAAGAVNIVYNNGCGSSTYPITVVAAPASITGTMTLCATADVILSDAIAGGTWSTSNAAIATNSGADVTGISAGTVTVSYSTGCGTPATATMLIRGTPTSITGASAICAGSTFAFTDSVTGGTWSSSYTSRASVVSSTGVVTGISAGAVNITYTNGCGSSTTPITVIAAPAAITGTTTECQYTDVILADASAGGTWSTSNAAIATNTGADVTGVSAGTVTVTYSTGCGTPATTIITVQGIPSLITGASTVCIGSNITLADSTSGGTWSSSSAGRASIISSTGVVTGISAGAVNISYTTGCGTTAIYPITVIGTPTAISGSTSVYAGSTSSLTDAVAYGTWSSSNTSIATVGSTGILGGIGTGTAVISYSTGCGAAATATVTVAAGPAPISGATSVCVGSTTTLTDVTPGGTWSSSNTGIASINSAGVVTGISNNTVTIYYTTTGGRATYVLSSIATPAAVTGTMTFCATASVTLADATAGGTWSTSNAAIATNTGATITGIANGTVTVTYSTGCGTPATAAILVKGTPSSITGASTLCVGSTFNFTDSASGGTWSSSSSGRASIISTTGVATGVSAGAVNITYTNGCGTSTYPTTVVAAPAAITGTTTECQYTDVILADAAAGGTWSTSNAAIATNSGADVTGVSGGTVTVTYSTGCGIPATTTITVKGIPSLITGAATVCTGSAITLSDSISGGTWSSSTTSRATVVSSTGVVTGISAGAVNISYTTGCGATATYAITVIASPSAITGTTSVCPGSGAILADATAGGTWSTSDPTIATNSGSTITGVAAGTVTVTYNNGCTTGATTVFTVKGVASAITGATSVCVGSPITLSDSVSAGTWSSANTARATVIGSTGVVTGVSAGTVNINYTTGCGTTATYAITIISAPAAISGTTSECIGSDVILADATAGGTWSTSNAAIATNSGAVIAGVSAGTVTVTYSNGCGSGATAIVTVKANPTTISGPVNLCVGSSTLLTEAATGGTWSSSNTARATVITATGAVTGVSAGSVNISYTNGCGTTVYAPINIISAPAAITGSGSACIAGTSALSDATAGGTWSSAMTSIATINTSGTAYGISAGTTNITYTAGGCNVVTTFTVKSAPAAITGTTTFCIGATDTLADATISGTWSSSPTSIATISAAGGAVTGIAAGTATISYSNGCGTPATATVHVQGAPTAISGSSNFCTGSTASFTNGISGGTWSSSNTAVATIDPSSGIATGISAGSVTISYSLTNSCGSHTVTYTSLVAATGTWLGTVSTNWSDGGNWVCGIIPDSTVNAVIPSSAPYQPAISGNYSVHNFNVGSGATVMISSGNTLNVKGSFTNTGMVGGSGYLSVNGTSAQTLYGTGYIYNLEIKNVAGASVNTGDTTKVKGTLLLTSGALTTNNGLQLASDSLNTGRIGTITGGTISGNVIIQQYIMGGRRAYRFWSHPFSSSIALSQIEQYVDITGSGGTTDGFTTTTTNAPSAYWYNPLVGNSTLGSDPGWQSFTNTNGAGSNAFNPYEGIRLFIRGGKGQGLDGVTYTPAAVRISTYGPVNTGSVTITMSKGTGTGEDFNLLGNPYPSPVDLGTVLTNAQTAGQITGGAFYVWNPYLGTSGQYVTVSIGSAYYLEGNASYEVRTAANGDVLTFNESNKTANISSVLLRNTSEYVALNIYDTSYHLWDMINLNFNDDATDKEDARYDGRKPEGPASLNFYSFSADNVKLSLDARPYAAGKVIPLGIKSAYAQQFIVKADNMTIPGGGEIFLVDKYLDRTVQLQQGTEYRFTITADSMSQGDNRFELRTGANTVQAAQSGSNMDMKLMPNPATDEVTVTYSTDGNKNVAVRLIDVSGNTLIYSDLGTQQNGTTKLSLQQFPAGIYIAELTSGSKKITQRLIKE